MDRIRRYITLGFALILMLSGMANGYANAMMAGSHSIEICSGQNVASVLLGANGEKLPELHECADCCIAVVVLQNAAPHCAHSGAVDLAVWRGVDHALTSGDALFSTWPRGPPIRV